MATLVAAPGSPARFAKAGLLEEALLVLAGLSAVEVGRTHLTGQQPFVLLSIAVAWNCTCLELREKMLMLPFCHKL